MSEITTTAGSTTTVAEIPDSALLQQEEPTCMNSVDSISISPTTVSFSDQFKNDHALRTGQSRGQSTIQSDIFAASMRAAGLDPSTSTPAGPMTGIPISRRHTVEIMPTGMPPRRLSGKMGSFTAKLQIGVGKLIGNQDLVQDGKKKEKLVEQDQLRLIRTLSVGNKQEEGGIGWLEKVRRRISESHVAVPPGYGAVWGKGGASGIAGIPHR